ncbi:MAG: IPT/TIG domain-containing protein [Acidimicrobiia bacterium]|nr:IPT/TIG domain-containing protein [Acidimicrobiia bacterium]
MRSALAGDDAVGVVQSGLSGLLTTNPLAAVEPVHGHHLDQITEVVVGWLGAAQLHHVSESELTFVTPNTNAVGPESDQRAELTFHTADGTSVNPGWAFTYQGSVPEVHSIEPLHGPREGGETVRVTGENLEHLHEVAVGSIGNVSMTHVSSTEVTFVAPNSNVVGPGQDERMGIVFHTSDGTMVTDSWMIFTYTGSTPTIAWVEPTYAHPTGGDVIQVGGTHVDHLTEVAVGDAGVQAMHPVSEGIVSFTMPPLLANHPAGADIPMGLIFHTTDGVDLPWPNLITYTPGHLVVPAHDDRPPTSDALAPGGRPSIHQLQPTSGPVAGGEWVSITGEHLDHVVSVTFGGVPAHFETRTSMEMLAYPPAHSAEMGATDVLVEVHSRSDGVSTENVHYQYGHAANTDAGLPSGAGLGQSQPLATPGANIGTGSSEQLTERPPG